MFIYSIVLPLFILGSFSCMVIQTTYARTYPISSVSAPSPLLFRFESTIRYICFQIYIRSLSILCSKFDEKYGRGYYKGKI
jgi:hypothetical protein